MTEVKKWVEFTVCFTLRRYKRTYKVQQDVCYREVCEPLLPKKSESQYSFSFMKKLNPFFSLTRVRPLNCPHRQEDAQTTVKVRAASAQRDIFHPRGSDSQL